jgi:chromosome partitioning protein
LTTTIAFFNNKGGVGKTTLVYHLAYMLAERGIPVLAVDLDPQCNLSAMFLPEERLEAIWKERHTLLSAIQPLVQRTGDLAPTEPEPILSNLHLLVGDLGLSRYEDLLAENWGKCLNGEAGAFRVMSAFHRIIEEAARKRGIGLALIDLGPNLGPLNRAALLAADRIVLPIAPDLFSLQGLENFGPKLVEWRKGWVKRVEEYRESSASEQDGLSLPEGRMEPIGYVLMSFGVRDNRPVKAYDHWTEKIPSTYRTAVLQQPLEESIPEPDPYRLAALKHYRSLMPMAMTARKPMFLLQSADGARGSHLDAVKKCYRDFLKLAQEIGRRIGLVVN